MGSAMLSGPWGRESGVPEESRSSEKFTGLAVFRPRWPPYGLLQIQRVQRSALGPFFITSGSSQPRRAEERQLRVFLS